MITKEIAINLTHGQILKHKTLKSSRGFPLEVRINGKCKTWKTRPKEFQIPYEYGLYDHGYIIEQNGWEWYE